MQDTRDTRNPRHGEIMMAEREEDTLRIAGEFARRLSKGAVAILTGDLGAGKTVFARGVARALGIGDDITSPTFTLIHEYTIPAGGGTDASHLYHMDLYRLEDTSEMTAIGIEDYLYGDGICLVEWGERLGDLLPEDADVVHIRHDASAGRIISIERGGGER